MPGTSFQWFKCGFYSASTFLSPLPNNNITIFCRGVLVHVVANRVDYTVLVTSTGKSILPTNSVDIIPCGELSMNRNSETHYQGLVVFSTQSTTALLIKLGLLWSSTAPALLPSLLTTFRGQDRPEYPWQLHLQYSSQRQPLKDQPPSQIVFLSRPVTRLLCAPVANSRSIINSLSAWQLELL